MPRENAPSRDAPSRSLQRYLIERRRAHVFTAPRAPPRGAAAHGAVFAAASDIQFLSHETIIDQMREMKVFKRKLKKARRRTLAAALRRGC